MVMNGELSNIRTPVFARLRYLIYFLEELIINYFVSKGSK